MNILDARTTAEAHLYMDLRGCEPGGRAHALVAHGDDLISTYKCRCDGQPREFAFRVAEPDPIGFGPGTSAIIGPGEFVAHADRLASSTPADPRQVPKEAHATARRRLELAAACLEQALRFAPTDADAVPATAFRTDTDRAIRDREPGRFSRARLEAVVRMYRELAARFG